ncbi:hypothetical protein [Micromonospora rifamycinica]|nr:hypothetical protein [Micromonospora rifamycinica]
MSWTPLQRQRLAQERLILGHYFPTLTWFNPTDPQSTFVEGPVNTNSGRYYSLRIHVPAAFPNRCPDMVVTAPHPLTDHHGRRITEASASMHTLGLRDDRTRICHFKENLWVPNNTLYLVALKGRIWLEAYEGHLRTGRPLDSFLPHM